MKRIRSGDAVTINLYNNTPYAKEHEEGGTSEPAVIKPPYVAAGATSVVTGGEVTKRTSMKPSEQILKTPLRLVEDKMRSFGW